MPPLAVVDLGTNTALLLVAERDAFGELRVLEDQAAIVRLGQGVDRTGRLHPEARARALACLRRYAARARELGAPGLHVAGTSALRDAADAADFCAEVARETGASVEVLSGEREAELSFRGALGGLGIEGPALIVDVGGGSTELALGDAGRMRARTSLDVGSVRLTERLVRSDPPTELEIALVEDTVRRALARGAPPLAADPCAVAVAGTATTLAAIHLELERYDGRRVHGLRMRREQVRSIRDRLAVLPLEVRRQVRGLDPARADVIVAGATVLLGVLEHYGLPEVIVSDRGLRFGLLQERWAASSPGPEPG